MSEPNISVLIDLIIPFVICLFILAIRGVGNRRVLTALVIWTGAWYGSGAVLADQPERVSRMLLMTIFAIAFFWQERLGLLNVGGSEAEADRLLRRVSGWLRESGADADAEAATAYASGLAPGTFPVGTGEWAVAAALFQQSLLRRAGRAPSTLTPASAYDGAARSYWQAALDRHLIVLRHHPSAWDEGVMLRCFHERFTTLIPRQALVERPLVPLGGWDVEAERIIDALAQVPVDAAVPTRDALVVAMTDSLALARGDRSDELLTRQHASAEGMSAEWAAQERREKDFIASNARRPSFPWASK